MDHDALVSKLISSHMQRARIADQRGNARTSYLDDSTIECGNSSRCIGYTNEVGEGGVNARAVAGGHTTIYSKM